MEDIELRLNISRITGARRTQRQGEALLGRLIGTPGARWVEREGGRHSWLFLTLPAGRVAGIAGLLRCWGVPETCYEVRGDVDAVERLIAATLAESAA